MSQSGVYIIGSRVFEWVMLDKLFGKRRISPPIFTVGATFFRLAALPASRPRAPGSPCSLFSPDSAPRSALPRFPEHPRRLLRPSCRRRLSPSVHAHPARPPLFPSYPLFFRSFPENAPTAQRPFALPPPGTPQRSALPRSPERPRRLLSVRSALPVPLSPGNALPGSPPLRAAPPRLTVPPLAPLYAFYIYVSKNYAKI